MVALDFHAGIVFLDHVTFLECHKAKFQAQAHFKTGVSIGTRGISQSFSQIVEIC